MQIITTPRKEKLSVALFNSLIASKVLQTGNDLECVGFTSELGNVAISFHGNIDNDYKVEVEDFGKMRGSKWVQFTPTEAQITKMQNAILDQAEAIQEAKVAESAPMIEEE